MLRYILERIQYVTFSICNNLICEFIALIYLCEFIELSSWCFCLLLYIPSYYSVKRSPMSNLIFMNAFTCFVCLTAGYQPYSRKFNSANFYIWACIF